EGAAEERALGGTRDGFSLRRTEAVRAADNRPQGSARENQKQSAELGRKPPAATSLDSRRPDGLFFFLSLFAAIFKKKADCAIHENKIRQVRTWLVQAISASGEICRTVSP
ncbi:MAG: hypothetical protein BJ554DRAFT_5632, partial [Olpidium bornovanus]